MMQKGLIAKVDEKYVRVLYMYRMCAVEHRRFVENCVGAFMRGVTDVFASNQTRESEIRNLETQSEKQLTHIKVRSFFVTKKFENYCYYHCTVRWDPIYL